MWCSHTLCARECQDVDSIIESDLQRSIAGNEGGHRRDTDVME